MLSPQQNTDLFASSYLETPASMMQCPSPKGFFNSVARTPAMYMSPYPIKTPPPYSDMVTNMIYDIYNQINVLKSMRRVQRSQQSVYASYMQLNGIVYSIVDSEYSAMETRIRTRIYQEKRLHAIEANLQSLKMSFDSMSDYK